MNGHLSYENSDRLQTMLNNRLRRFESSEWNHFLKNNGIGAKSPGFDGFRHWTGIGWGEIKDGFVTMADPNGYRWLLVPEELAMKALTLGVLP